MSTLIYRITPLLAIAGVSMLAGCGTTKFMKQNEFLLSKNEIILTSTKEIKNKGNLKYELSTLYKQQPNSRFFFFVPRQWFYYQTNNPADTTWWKNWQRRRAERPAIFSDSLADATRQQMQYYLNYLGHFEAAVNYEPIESGQKVKVRYYVEPKAPVLVDTIHFYSQDTAVHKALQDIGRETVFKRGVPLAGSLYDAERERISKTLRNQGYAYFYSNNIAPLEVDTIGDQAHAILYLEVNPPYTESNYQKYLIGKVTIVPQYDAALPDSVYSDTLLGEYHFKTLQPDFTVRPQTIFSNLHLHSGAYYSQENYDLSIRQLSALGVFRFVRIRMDPSTENPGIIDLRVELTPNDKYEIGLDVEANYIDGTTLTGRGSLIGFSLLPIARNRNLFGGAELLVTNLNAGVEVNLSQLRSNAFWNSVELGFQNDLFFPKFVDYLGIWKGYSRFENRTEKSTYKLFQEKAATRLSTRFSYIFNLGFYRTSLLNASFGYDVPRNNNTRYVLDHIGIDYLRPVTEVTFDSIIAANPFLERSFGKQLFVSFLFKEFNLIHQRRPNRFGESGYYALKVELSGAEIGLANSLFNAIAAREDTFRLFSIPFAQYARAEGDVRYYKEYSPKLVFATRFNLGVARPFGRTSDVPFVKQFFAGGPNSIRGWAARGLGPGGYLDTLSDNLSRRLLFYQTGDLKLEFNAELRFHMFSKLKGALFLDAGNVWTLDNDPTRCGSQFLLRTRASSNCPEHTPNLDAFYKQIAIGSGMGFRLDFNYFIFRLDLGIQLRNPRPVRNMMNPSPKESDYWENFSGWGIRDINFNFGLGYPF
jgi:outer membrane protein insertion porin family